MLSFIDHSCGLSTQKLWLKSSIIHPHNICLSQVSMLSINIARIILYTTKYLTHETMKYCTELPYTQISLLQINGDIYVLYLECGTTLTLCTNFSCKSSYIIIWNTSCKIWTRCCYALLCSGSTTSAEIFHATYVCISKDYFIVRLPRCQWSNPERYMEIDWYEVNNVLIVCIMFWGYTERYDISYSNNIFVHYAQYDNAWWRHDIWRFS